METIGTMTSQPNKNGEHDLKCPNCMTLFLAAITKNDETGDINDVICPSCSHTDQPLAFLYTAQKDQADKMAHEFVDKKIKLFMNNHSFKLRL